MIKLYDKHFKPLIPASQIAEAVDGVARRLNEDYGTSQQPPVFVGVLNGAFMFLSDLVKRLDFVCEVTFVKVSSYDGMASTDTVSTVMGVGCPIEGRDMVVVEDIVDTGASIEHLVVELRKSNPRSIRICTLFFKPQAYRKSIPIDYAAMEIGNEFVVGYGMDYNQLGRNLRDIHVVCG